MRTFLLVAVTSCLLATPLVTLGETVPMPVVLLSEVAWAGSSRSDADEWLELANLSDAPVDLANWRIEGAAGSSPLVIPNGSIPAHGTFLISNYNLENEKTILNIAPQYVTSSVSLSNSSLHLVLKDASGLMLDEVTGNSIGNTGSSRASMERVSLDTWQTATTSEGLVATGTDFGTPGTLRIAAPPPPAPEPAPDIPANEPGPSDTVSGPPIISEMSPEEPAPTVENGSPTPESSSTEIYISDGTGSPIESGMTTPEDPASLPPLSPPPPPSPIPTLSPPSPINPPIDPPGYAEHDIIITEFSTRGDEWVEYRNETSDPITLEGFRIEDATGHKTALTGVLTAHSYGLARTSPGTLNNDGDLIRLRDRSGRVLDEVRYGKSSGLVPVPPEGSVAARTKVSEISNNDFVLTTTPTPGAQNIVTGEDVDPPEITAPVATPAPKLAMAASTLTTNSAKTAPKTKPKLTITGPTTFYAKQSGIFLATLSGAGSGDTPIEWFLDDAPIGTTRTIEIVGTVGRHELRASVELDDRTLEASRVIRVRAFPATLTTPSALSTVPKNPLPANPKRSASSGSRVGVSVVVTGTVTAGERIVGVRKFLIEDGTTVYLKVGKLPVIAPGDIIRAIGTKNAAGDKLTVKTAANIRVTGHETVTPEAISSGDASEELRNKLVAISGTIKSAKTKSFTLTDDGDVDVLWKIGESLPEGLVQIGAEARVAGILTLRGPNWVIMPRGAEDITVLKPAPPKSPSFDPRALAGLGTNLAVALATLFASLGARHMIAQFLLKRKQKLQMEYETEIT